MKHIRTSSLLLILALISCERIVDYPLDESGRIYVSAILGQIADGRINVAVSQPALGSDDTSVEDVNLSLKAGGRPVELIRDMDYASDVKGEISYIVGEKFNPGTELELTAEASGLPPVKTSTTVPPPIPDVKLSYQEVQSYKNKHPGQVMDNVTTLLEFHIKMDERPLKDFFWGVQVCRKEVYDTLGKVPEHHWDDYKDKSGVVKYDDIYVNTQFQEGSAISSLKLELVTVFDGGDMIVIPADAEGDCSSLDVYVYPTENRRLAGSYMENEWWEIYVAYEYSIRLYRLSPEMYRCIMARHTIDESRIPIHLGFSPVTYTYTNVEGGLGMFGAVSAYESDWFRID